MNESSSLKEFCSFITGQIDKINHSLQLHRVQLQRIDDLNNNIKKQDRKYQQLQKKMRLMEIYQGQNFKNNQRIFNSYNSYESLQRKVQTLENTQLKILLSNNNVNKQEDIQNSKFILIQDRLKDIELQMERNRSKGMVSNKFRKITSTSPRLINSQSTKDMSIDTDNYLNKKEIKRIEKKLQDFVVQKIKLLQYKLNNSFCHQKHNIANHKIQGHQGFDNYQNALQFKQNEHKKSHPYENGQEKIRKYIDMYYTQQTQRQNLSIDTKLKKKTRQKQIKKSKLSNSKSKDNKQKKSLSKQKISLNSVKEYLKIRNKK